MSPSRNEPRQKKNSRPLLRKISSRDQLFLRRPATKSRSTIIFNGGPTFRVPTGGIRSGLRATLTEKKSIPLSRSHTQTPKRTPNGQGSVCPPKRNSNLLRGAVCLEKHMSGEMNCGLTGNAWQTRGRENFRYKTRVTTVMPESRQ